MQYSSTVGCVECGVPMHHDPDRQHVREDGRQVDFYRCDRCNRDAEVLQSRVGGPVDQEDTRSHVERAVERSGGWFPRD